MNIRILLMHLGLDYKIVKGAIIPFAFAIDFYYRLEWFDLHTAWGKVILSFVFGGE